MISENPTTEELQRRIRALEREVADYKARLANERIAAMKRTRYGLVWEDVPEAFDAEAENSIPILEEVPALSVVQDDGKPTHLLIEGDNYHALTCLNYTHRGRIDVIYIDPPYNTGSDGFTYRDRRYLTQFPNGQKIDSNHPLRHSAWLSFMEKRLRLAKELLSQRGVIFISIDDNEQANLKLLCDKVFGEIVAQFVWKSKSGGANDASAIAIDHEYILCYCKNINKANFQLDKAAVVTTSYNKQDANGRYSLDRLDKQSLGYQPSLDFPIIGPDGREYIVHHKDPNNKKARWRWGKDTVKERYDELVFIYPYVYTKNYEKLDGQKPRSLLIEDRFGRTRTGSTDLKAVIGLQNKFQYPKPLSLLKYVISIGGDADATILDFFAGSGTTLHAVAQLNADDGGRRQCILVQQQEETKICETVTRERCRKVLTGYRSQKGEDVKGLGGSLRYYRTAFVGKHRAAQAGDEDAVALALKAGCLLAIAENTLCEVKHTDHYQIFTGCATRTTAIYFRESVEEFEAFLADIRQTEGRVVAYVFSWGDASEFEDDFADFDGRVELKAIPKPILDIYKALA